jgi:predicted nucleic acid-binding protein
VILADTNVLSEAIRPAPARLVVDWLNRRFPECAISTVTVFELKAGVAMLDPGARRDALDSAIDRMVSRFGARIYAFDTACALAAARLLAAARGAGLGLQQIPAKLADLQIAGTASAYGLELATRNTGDFQGLGLALVNPWTAD